MVTISADTASVSVTGHPATVVAGGVAVADPYWNNVSFLIGYDGDPVVDEGPRRVTVTDVATPTRTVPAVGSGGGAYNQTSTSSYRNWVTADRLLDGARPGKFYWEFEANPSGPAQFSGYHGVVSRNQLDDPTRTYDSGNDPFYHGSLVYRGSGDTRGNGAIRKAGTNSYGAGDVVMIAFEPSTGKFWVGLNGTWEDDPTVDPPTRTSDDAGGDFWPVLQAREPGEGGTLRSVASQFSYAVPTGCTALGGEVIIPPGATVSVLNEYGIVGVTRGAAVFGLNEYDIVGVTRGAAVFGLNEYDIVGVTRGAAVFGLNEYVILE